MDALSIEDLTKRYEDKAVVDNFSMKVESGEIVGLLGPNGAGKSTLVETALGLRIRDQGRSSVLGSVVVDSGLSLQQKQNTGLCFQIPALPMQFTVREYLGLLARAYPSPRDVSSLIGTFGMESVETRQLAKLSGGQKKRVAVAAALVGNPKLVVLDEPTSDLDPQARHVVWHSLLQLKDQGAGVLLTTHQMDEAAHLCDRVVIMDRGKKLADNSPRALIASLPVADTTLEIDVAAPVDEGFLADLRALLGVNTKVEGKDNALRISRDQPGALAGILRTLLDNGVNPTFIRAQSGSLDEVFLHLTGRSIR